MTVGWMDRAQVLANVKLNPAGQSLRKGPLLGAFFSCPVSLASHVYDVRIILGGKNLLLGEERECPIFFIDWEHAKVDAIIGAKFDILQLAPIGSGVVLKVLQKC